MVRRVLATASLALACGAPPAPVAAPPARVATTPVVTLIPDTPSAILRGPFEVASVNPGSDLSLYLSATGSCGDAVATWFQYTGGGLVVPADHTLCARSRSKAAVVHAFSGFTMSVREPDSRDDTPTDGDD